MDGVFWYNATANVFSLSLKSEYLPEFVNEDYLVEDILQRAIIEESIEYQKPKLNKDFITIISKSRGLIDVEEYDVILLLDRPNDYLLF